MDRWSEGYLSEEMYNIWKGDLMPKKKKKLRRKRKKLKRKRRDSEEEIRLEENTGLKE